jgi:hypothetical protein
MSNARLKIQGTSRHNGEDLDGQHHAVGPGDQQKTMGGAPHGEFIHEISARELMHPRWHLRSSII